MTTANLDSADLIAVAHQGLINEDVLQQIFDISRIPLPLTDRIGSDNIDNAYASWTQDTLAAPDITNAAIDGADTDGANDTVTGARVGNHAQICTKTVQVSTRARQSSFIGANDVLAYQVMQRNREIRRDVEAISLLGQASVGDTGAAAGTAAGIPSWLTTNTFRGATGADGGFGGTTADIVDAPTAGTARGLTETLVRDAAQAVYEAGGDPTILMMVPGVCRALSEYMFTSSARIATLTSETTQSRNAAVAKGSVSVFVTDFGVTMEMVANRLQPDGVGGDTDVSDVLLLDPMYLRHGFLHGYRVEPLAKTGLADKRQMAVDWTLKVLTEAAHAVISDVDKTIAVIQ